MITKAAVLIKKNNIRVVKLKIPKLKIGQVLVKVLYSSICHTQVQEIMGLRGKDKYLPHCLGHEATAKVISVGPKVTKFKKGQKVCLTWIPSSGLKGSKTEYLSMNNKIINTGPVSTFSKYAIVSENRILKLPKKCNLKRDVLMGCAIPTAFNAVFNTLKHSTKENIIIFGSGGLGLACIYAAKYAGFKKIYAADIISSKLKIALRFGATNIIQLKKNNFNQIMKPYNNYFNAAIECTGNLNVIKNSLSTIRNFGGQLIVIGNYPFFKNIKVDPWNFVMGKVIKGAWQNEVSYNNKFNKFYKKLSKFKWKKFFGSKVYKLDQISLALNDLKKGKVIRPLIKM